MFPYVSLPRQYKLKTEINKWDLIKLIGFFTAKETIKTNEKTIYGMGENSGK